MQHLAGRLGLGVRAEGAEDGVDERAHAALERLEHDVAGEAVGDDHVDVGGHHVAALDVADEGAAGGVERLGAVEERVGLLHERRALGCLLADRTASPTRGCSMP